MKAAGSLKLSHPTVWKQVHALERVVGAQLVESHARGCNLTAAGRLLVQMVTPTVESIGSLEERFKAAVNDTWSHLTIAVPQRILVEDLAACVGTFRAQFPKSRFTFCQTLNVEVAQLVETRGADFGFTPSAVTIEQSQNLIANPCYQLEVRLITPPGHPLALRRRLHPRHLRGYPMINVSDELPGPLTWTALNEHQAYQRETAVLQTGGIVAIRRFVQLGFGIGLVPASVVTQSHPELHERSMSDHFGHILVYVVQRRGAFVPPLATEFIRLVQQELRFNRKSG